MTLFRRRRKREQEHDQHRRDIKVIKSRLTKNEADLRSLRFQLGVIRDSGER